MENKKDKSRCARCGHTTSDEFVGDICPWCGFPYWKCSNCGFTVTADSPPQVCPSCGEKCNFRNVTCYLPDCGGPGNIDPRL